MLISKTNISPLKFNYAHLIKACCLLVYYTLREMTLYMSLKNKNNKNCSYVIPLNHKTCLKSTDCSTLE